MMDIDGDGYLTRQELMSLTESMHRSLGNVQLVVDREADYFTDRIFSLFILLFFDYLLLSFSFFAAYFFDWSRYFP